MSGNIITCFKEICLLLNVLVALDFLVHRVEIKLYKYRYSRSLLVQLYIEVVGIGGIFLRMNVFQHY